MRQSRFYLPGDVIGGGYTIVKLLGTGGSGAVYKVKRGEDTFAAKLCRFAADTLGEEERALFIHRLEREYRLLRALQHPKIVRVHELGWHEGLPFYTMDFLDGFPLSVFVREAKPTLVERIDLFADVTEAIAYLHERGVCHRDIKPSNVIVCESGVFLVDLGLGKPSRATPFTGAENWLGTIEYMSPEYAAYVARTVGWRPPSAPFKFRPSHDVFALGVTFYEVLTGLLPFSTPATHTARLLREIRFRAPKHPCDVNATIPRPLGELVMKMLEKNPKLRFQDARAAHQALLSTVEACAAELEAVDEVESVLPSPATPTPTPSTLPDSGEWRKRGLGWALGAWEWTRAAPGLVVAIVLATSLATLGVRALVRTESASSLLASETRMEVRPEDITPDAGLVPPVVKVMAGALIQGPVPGQLRPPCPKEFDAIKGGCWSQHAFHVLDDNAYPKMCNEEKDRKSGDVYIFSVDDCVKNHRFFSPVMAVPKAVEPLGR